MDELIVRLLDAGGTMAILVALVVWWFLSKSMRNSKTKHNPGVDNSGNPGLEVLLTEMNGHLEAIKNRLEDVWKAVKH